MGLSEKSDLHFHYKKQIKTAIWGSIPSFQTRPVFIHAPFIRYHPPASPSQPVAVPRRTYTQVPGAILGAEVFILLLSISGKRLQFANWTITIKMGLNQRFLSCSIAM